MYAMRWLPQDAEEQNSDVHRLEIFFGDKRKTIFFSEAELVEGPGAPESEAALRQRVDRFLERLPASPGQS